MANILNDKEAQQALASENFGIEVTEVDFAEFDRRKAPRISNYQAFVDDLEPAPIAIEFVLP